MTEHVTGHADEVTALLDLAEMLRAESPSRGDVLIFVAYLHGDLLQHEHVPMCAGTMGGVRSELHRLGRSRREHAPDAVMASGCSDFIDGPVTTGPRYLTVVTTVSMRDGRRAHRIRWPDGQVKQHSSDDGRSLRTPTLDCLWRGIDGRRIDTWTRYDVCERS